VSILGGSGHGHASGLAPLTWSPRLDSPSPPTGGLVYRAALPWLWDDDEAT
jgi:hypothetical protein